LQKELPKPWIILLGYYLLSSSQFL